jgi:hypothetical protein
MNTEYKILRGLPGDGPTPELFSPSGQGAHREGLVVEFQSSKGKRWIGNFQPGFCGADNVVKHPNDQFFMVISLGQGYLVNPDNPKEKNYFGGYIQHIIELPQFLSVVFGNGIAFVCIGRSGLLWKTKRISWDGMQNLRVVGQQLSGESWSPIDNKWIPFELDLVTGKCNGGSYNGPE